MPALDPQKARPWRGRGWRVLEVGLLLILEATRTRSGVVAASDRAEVENGVKAAYIYNFARFVEWPERRDVGPVRIGVLGRGDLASPLTAVVRGRSANGRPIQISRVTSVLEAERCDILLIERSEFNNLTDIAQALAGKPVLTVCDGGNCFRDGAMIVFQIVDDSVRFQINQEAAEHAGLRISSQLLKVALPVAGKRL